MKPLILIGGGPAYDRVFSDSSFLVNKTYPLAVAAAGGTPVMPLHLELIDEYADRADGLILTGSISYVPSPDLAGKLAKEENPKREERDSALFQAFYKRGKPILGICLGLQVINVEMGGTLITNFKFQESIEHMMIEHEVTTTEGSLLRELFGERFWVNSRHNRRIGELGKELIVTATSPDGVIEAIEHESLPIYAVEWHPERMRGDITDPPCGPDMSPLFERFIAICAKK